MSEPYIGQIMIAGFNFAPRGWAFCNGQLLPVSQNSALFSLLGTIYGGDGRTTFALPDLRGRFPLHAAGGNGPGLSNHVLGQKGGRESISEVPQHTHTASLHGELAQADKNDSRGNLLAGGTGATIYAEPNSNDNTTMSAQSIVVAPSGNPTVDVMNPYLGLNFVIALTGIYPSRS